MTVDPNVLDFRYVLVKHHKKTGLPFRSRAHIFLAQKDTILGSSKRDSLELNRLSQDNLDYIAVTVVIVTGNKLQYLCRPSYNYEVSESSRCLF